MTVKNKPYISAGKFCLYDLRNGTPYRSQFSLAGLTGNISPPFPLVKPTDAAHILLFIDTR